MHSGEVATEEGLTVTNFARLNPGQDEHLHRTASGAGTENEKPSREGDEPARAPPEIKPPLPQEVPAPQPSQPEIVPVETPPPMDPGLPQPEA